MQARAQNGHVGSLHRRGDNHTVLLTGTTGSLGSYLLDVLARNHNVARVICFNRTADALERQKKSNEARGLTHDLDGDDRIEFHTGDLTQDYFGLAPTTYHLLTQTVTHIIHNAWPVDFNRSVASFEPQINGVRKLVEFAHASRKNASIFFLSSVSTVGEWAKISQHRHTIPEAPVQDWRLAALGYGQSKLISERLLEEAAEHSGVRATVCRVGQVAGPVLREEKGQWPKQEWVPSLIASSVYLKLLPETLGKYDVIDWIPVDILADIMVELAFAASDCDCGKGHPKATFVHTVNPNVVLWRDLWSAVLDYMPHGTKIVTYRRWIDELKRSHADDSDNNAENPAVKLLPFFESLQPASKGTVPDIRPVFETGKTCQLNPKLEEMGPITEAWISLWMRQWALPGT